jgi:hypothetical protein
MEFACIPVVGALFERKVANYDARAMRGRLRITGELSAAASRQ